jgi:hypothetical protein
MAMTRKEFLKSAAVVVGGGMALSTLGCDGGGGGGDGCTSVIQLNHGHAITFTRADAEAGADKTYHIKGGADHDHTVTITAAQFADVLAGTQVVSASSFDDVGATHQHDITLNCT